MAAPKSVRRKSGEPINVSDPVDVPVSTAELAAAVVQLQNTVNELISRFNEHEHAALDAPTSTLVDGTGADATDLFTTA